MVFGQKKQGFMERPRFTAHVRAEFIGHYLGVLPTTVQVQMCRLGLSLQDLNDCVAYLKIKTKKSIERKDIQKLESLDNQKIS